MRPAAAVARDLMKAWWKAWADPGLPPEVSFLRHAEAIVSADRRQLLQVQDETPTPTTRCEPFATIANVPVTHVHYLAPHAPKQEHATRMDLADRVAEKRSAGGRAPL